MKRGWLKAVSVTFFCSLDFYLDGMAVGAAVGGAVKGTIGGWDMAHLVHKFSVAVGRYVKISSYLSELILIDYVTEQSNVDRQCRKRS